MDENDDHFAPETSPMYHAVSPLNLLIPKVARSTAQREREALSASSLISQESFLELALPLLPVLYSVAARLAGSREIAEDLVQETLLRAWSKLETFQPGTNFRAWVLRILTLLYFNELRRRKKAPVPIDEGLDAVAAPPEPVPAGIVDWQALADAELGDEMKQALESLNEEQRMVFVMITIGELSYQECADALRLPMGTVMSRLSRARTHLKENLRAHALRLGFLRKGQD